MINILGYGMLRDRLELTYDGSCEVLVINVGVNGGEVWTSTAVERYFVHDFPT